MLKAEWEETVLALIVREVAQNFIGILRQAGMYTSERPPAFVLTTVDTILLNLLEFSIDSVCHTPSVMHSSVMDSLVSCLNVVSIIDALF